MIIIGPINMQDFLRTLFPDVDEGNEEHEGYYCLKLNPPLLCGCGHEQQFFEPEEVHLVVVWEEKDDEVLLRTAACAMKLKKDPRIVEYKMEYGPSIEFYEARRDGMFQV